MAWELRDGYGTLFRDREKRSDKAPDYRGEIMVGGVRYELAAWVKEGKSGKFFSLKAQEPQQRADQAPHTPADDDIPF